jgi:peptidoglycan/xylan/chitin deacetylase (PgdA/CDA1 family)
VSSERIAAKATRPPLEPPQPPPRAWWRRAVAAGMYGSGMLHLARRASRVWELSPDRKLPSWHAVRPKFAILCYHRVGMEGVPLYSALPPEAFEAQMRYLRSRYRVISLAETCDELVQPRSLEPSVAITFDDGYADLFHHAFPVLKKYGIPATVFLAVGAIESGDVPWYDRVFVALQILGGRRLELELDTPLRFVLGSPAERLEVAQQIVRRLRMLPDAQRLECCAEIEKRIALPAEALSGRMLSWSQVREMQRSGVAFGSHTVSHRVMSRLRPDEARHELLDSKRIIEEHLDSVVDTFAFPFGQPADIGPTVGSMLASCGYRCAATTVEGTNVPGTNPYELRRTQVCEERSLPFFAWKLNALFLKRASRDLLHLPPRDALQEQKGSAVEVGHA